MIHAAIRRFSPLLAAAAAALFLAPGCVSLNKPRPERRYYVLDVRRPDSPPARSEPARLHVTPVRVSPEFQGREFVYRTGAYSYTTDFYNEFLIPPADLLKAQIKRWLAGAGYATEDPDDAIGPDSWLLYTVTPRLYGDFRPDKGPAATLEIEVFLRAPSTAGGDIRLQKTYAKEIAVDDRKAASIVEGWNEGLEAILSDLEADLGTVDWSAKR